MLVAGGAILTSAFLSRFLTHAQSNPLVSKAWYCEGIDHDSYYARKR